jgi:hypothetical protein
MHILGNGIYSGCTGDGDNEVCSNTIDGSGWSNYVLTYLNKLHFMLNISLQVYNPPVHLTLCQTTLLLWK